MSGERRLIEGAGGAALTAPVQVISLEGGAAAYRPARIEIRSGRIAALHDCEGRPALFATSGLVNCHVHWLMLSGTSMDDLVSRIEGSPGEMRERALANARATLRAGVTTACDKGSPGRSTAWLYQEIEAARAAGEPVPRTPYAPWMFVADGSFADRWCTMLLEDGGPGARAGQVAAAGGRVVKIIPETDWLPEAPHYRLTLSLAQIRAAREEARRRGLLFALHAKGEAALEAAIEVGADAVEHAIEARREHLEAMDARGISVALTLEGFACRLSYAEQHGKRLEVARYEWEQANRVARLAASLHGGAPLRGLVFGSDAGSFNTPHGSLKELVHLRRAGLSAAGALEAATVSGARCLRLSDEIGAVRPGLAADLVLWREDPLSLPVEAWAELERSIAAVVIDGRVAHEAAP